MPKCSWGEAILSSAFLINRMPSRILDMQTPLDTLLKSYPTSRLHQNLPLSVFGYTCFVHYNAPGHSKLEPRAIKCVFLGYSSTKRGYKCFDPTSGKLFVTMDATFFEQEPYFSKNTLQGENLNEDCFWNPSEQTIDPSSSSEPPPLTLPQIPTLNKSSVPSIIEKSVTRRDTHSLRPAEPLKQQLRVYSR